MTSSARSRMPTRDRADRVLAKLDLSLKLSRREEVERVERLATEKQWTRAYQEIVEFEESLVAEGMILVKFWMHISDAEQLRRFERRRDDPLRVWKLTDEDWRNRKKRKQYERAVEEMIARTSHDAAPLHLVEGDDERYARVRVI